MTGYATYKVSYILCEQKPFWFPLSFPLRSHHTKSIEQMSMHCSDKTIPWSHLAIHHRVGRISRQARNWVLVVVSLVMDELTRPSQNNSFHCHPLGRQEEVRYSCSWWFAVKLFSRTFPGQASAQYYPSGVWNLFGTIDVITSFGELRTLYGNRITWLPHCQERSSEQRSLFD